MIPFLDLKAQYRSVGEELEAAVLAALRSTEYILGEPVARFECEFARYCGAEHAIAVSSGTAALHLALLAAGVMPGDEVITVPATFVATVAAILYAGARPVLVDVDPTTWTMDPAALEAAITPRTRAVMPVHFHGRLADMDAIADITRRHRLILIEDAAQAHGASRGGRRAGTFGDLGCFSFYPGKNLGAAGEGGAVVTDDYALAERVRSLRDWGKSSRFIHALKGYNYRLDTVQCAVLGVKLARLEAWNAARRRVANAYHIGLAAHVQRAAGPFGEDHAGHVYAILTEDRDAVMAELTKAGIGTNVHYARPVHLQPAYADLGYQPGDFPVAEDYARQTLSLPIYPELSPADVAHVIEAVNAVTARRQSLLLERAELAS
ncbi:erythromycin biosynthesis sensory transduction protein eryC1 [Acuticoccus sediminis]|uniref:Erythromycin biosynthesis sensory transduction protein eryC1 n=1 Tax=Acuticoccus sediminis TaxID=2184697 RepID=A0A8B2NGF7_9HYPH|nr:DegT/DnrJ/EryC1/StrS family aminotransferase [Acuticoccus sediminis]RAH98340.1 erythromycin biosynthesis sensory transduction protein eryC1 [Acuticoccus sediminis]